MGDPWTGVGGPAHLTWTVDQRSSDSCGAASCWQDVQELERRRDSLLELQRNLPALVKQLETESAALADAQQQQALLLGLLAGRDKVQTFLALLNQQALFSGVAIQRYEPINMPPPSSKSPKSHRAQPRNRGCGIRADRPLLAAGYQKTSVGLAVRVPPPVCRISPAHGSSGVVG